MYLIQIGPELVVGSGRTQLPLMGAFGENGTGRS